MKSTRIVMESGRTWSEAAASASWEATGFITLLLITVWSLFVHYPALCMTLQDGISALRLWSLSLPEGAVWEKVKYAPPSLGCWALIRQCPVASCPQHECAFKQACSTSVLITSPCVSKVTKTQELCQDFECVAKPVVPTYGVPLGGIKMSTPFEGLNSLKQLQMYPLNK